MKRALVTLSLLLLLVAPPAHALEVGEKAPDFLLTDVFGSRYTLASFKKRILSVWYEGPGSYKQNERLSFKLRDEKIAGRWPGPNMDSIGIANFQESAVPNAVLDLMIKREWKKSKALVLCDRDARMQRLWGFRNGRSNIYVLDASRTLIWKTSGPLDARRERQFLRFLQRITR